MRILIGIDTFGLVGGSERYAIEVAEELARRGHEIAVLCGEATRAAPPGARLIVAPTYSKQRADERELDALARTVAELRPDAIYLLSARGRSAVARLTERRSAPLVRFVQDHTLFCPGLNKMFHDGGVCERPLGVACLERYFLHEGCTAFRRELHRGPLDALGGVWKWKRGLALARRADRLVVGSRYMRDELLRAGVERERVAVLPYFTRSSTGAIAARPPDDATRAFVEQAREPVLLTPARLALPDKGVDYLITALGKLRAPFRAVIAGSGPAEAWLKRKTNDEGLAQRVHFAGWQDAGAIEWLHERALAVVFPSVWNEPFGLVGIEAMAHAKPVIAFAVGGVVDWLEDGVTGLLAPRRDADALAAAIDRVLGDPACARTLGRAGRERWQREFTAERHLAALERLLADPRGA